MTFLKCFSISFLVLAVCCVAANVTLPPAVDCTKGKNLCPSGTICTGHLPSRVCKPPAAEGQPCNRTTNELCATGLHCSRSVCARAPARVPLGGSCAPRGAICARTTRCATGDKGKRCVAPVRLGKMCDGAYNVCNRKQHCVSGVCERQPVPLGNSCKWRGLVCVSGSSCITVRNRKRCFTVGVVNDSCLFKAFKVCGNGLDCVEDICVIPAATIKHQCDVDRKKCADGMICVKNESGNTCVMPIPAGDKCIADNPFSICTDGTTCNGKYCEEVVLYTDSSCLSERSTCEAGMVCAGSDSDKKCVAPIGEGEECVRHDIFSVCEDGMTCQNGRCKYTTVPENGDCLTAGAKCEKGTTCVGNDDEKICVTPIPAGADCLPNDPFAICVEGHVCKYGLCSERKIAENQECTSGALACDEGTVCAGTTDHKLCVKPMPEGESCGADAYWICKEGLQCTDNICINLPLPLQSPALAGCGASDQPCAADQACMQDHCVEQLAVGKGCSEKVTVSACVTGAICKSGLCVREGRKGDQCETLDRCGDGLYCGYTARGRQRECISYAGVDQACGRRLLCTDRLTCSFGRCKETVGDEAWYW